MKVTVTAITPISISTLLTVVIFVASSDLSLLGSPCVFEGRVSTSNNWYGYLANLSVKHTGRMMFEFTYSSDRCCINVLFYSEEQMLSVSARMNCWQKEHLLLPEDDQIIRLTPRFSWAGCHVTHNSILPEYSCEGGRSFAVDNVSNDFSTWYVAVSNCATRSGLDIAYRLTVYEHFGLCRNQLIAPPYSPLALATDGKDSRSDDVKPWSVKWAESLNPTCVIEGTVNTGMTWYGFLANISLRSGGGFYFQIQFPVKPQQSLATQSVHVLLYTDSDVSRLDIKRTCWQRYAVIRQRAVFEQVIELHSKSSWNGCASDNLTGDGLVVNCRGQRRFNEPRVFHIAVVNCRSSSGLQVKYRFDVYGFNKLETCSSGHLDPTASCLVTSALFSRVLFIILHP